MKTSTAFVLGITVSSVVYIIYGTTNVIHTKKQYAEQRVRHTALIHKIREVIQGTSYEMFYDQYVRILTNTYKRCSLVEYGEVIDDIDFIIDQLVPQEFILSKLETYMVILDELHDLRISKKNKNLKENYYVYF